GGMAENYITPEQSVPSHALTVPWESCVSMGHGFAYSYDDKFKSTRTLLRMLIDVVAKGGNLALNVAPQPDGRLPWPAYQRMREMGAWLRQYGDAIYGTRIVAPFVTEGFAFTQKAKENKVYAFSLAGDAGKLNIPFTGKKVTQVVNMTTGEAIPFTQTDSGVEVTVVAIAPSEAYGGEHIAEVFELTVE
ncbi:MAG: alpha-L-fucosidase, partial [Defluviitaleaceae bacterium]|nr:alpha-L-fucosidase [Defluviitaleaceae bacterium]